MTRKPYTKKTKKIELTDDLVVKQTDPAIKKTRTPKKLEVVSEVASAIEILQSENTELKERLEMAHSEIRIISESCICIDLKEELRVSKNTVVGLEKSIELIRKRTIDIEADRKQELAFNYKSNILNTGLFVTNLVVASWFFYTLIG